MAKLVNVNLCRINETSSWGFRMQGGADFNQPLSVQRVKPCSIASNMLSTGDIILMIGGNDVRTMCHFDACELIKNAGNYVQLSIRKANSQYLCDENYEQQEKMEEEFVQRKLLYDETTSRLRREREQRHSSIGSESSLPSTPQSCLSPTIQKLYAPIKPEVLSPTGEKHSNPSSDITYPSFFEADTVNKVWTGTSSNHEDINLPFKNITQTNSRMLNKISSDVQINKFVEKPASQFYQTNSEINFSRQTENRGNEFLKNEIMENEICENKIRENIIIENENRKNEARDIENRENLIRENKIRENEIKNNKAGQNKIREILNRVNDTKKIEARQNETKESLIRVNDTKKIEASPNETREFLIRINDTKKIETRQNDLRQNLIRDNENKIIQERQNEIIENLIREPETKIDEIRENGNRRNNFKAILSNFERNTKNSHISKENTDNRFWGDRSSSVPPDADYCTNYTTEEKITPLRFSESNNLKRNSVDVRSSSVKKDYAQSEQSYNGSEDLNESGRMQNLSSDPKQRQLQILIHEKVRLEELMMKAKRRQGEAEVRHEKFGEKTSDSDSDSSIVHSKNNVPNTKERNVHTSCDEINVNRIKQIKSIRKRNEKKIMRQEIKIRDEKIRKMQEQKYKEKLRAEKSSIDKQSSIIDIRSKELVKSYSENYTNNSSNNRGTQLQPCKQERDVTFSKYKQEKNHQLSHCTQERENQVFQSNFEPNHLVSQGQQEKEGEFPLSKQFSLENYHLASSTIIKNNLPGGLPIASATQEHLFTHKEQTVNASFEKPFNEGHYNNLINNKTCFSENIFDKLNHNYNDSKINYFTPNQNSKELQQLAQKEDNPLLTELYIKEQPICDAKYENISTIPVSEPKYNKFVGKVSSNVVYPDKQTELDVLNNIAIAQEFILNDNKKEENQELTFERLKDEEIYQMKKEYITGNKSYDDSHRKEFTNNGGRRTLMLEEKFPELQATSEEQLCDAQEISLRNLERQIQRQKFRQSPHVTPESNSIPANNSTQKQEPYRKKPELRAKWNTSETVARPSNEPDQESMSSTDYSSEHGLRKAITKFNPDPMEFGFKPIETPNRLSKSTGNLDCCPSAFSIIHVAGAEAGMAAVRNQSLSKIRSRNRSNANSLEDLRQVSCKPPLPSPGKQKPIKMRHATSEEGLLRSERSEEDLRRHTYAEGEKYVDVSEVKPPMDPIDYIQLMNEYYSAYYESYYRTLYKSLYS